MTTFENEIEAKCEFVGVTVVTETVVRNKRVYVRVLAEPSDTLITATRLIPMGDQRELGKFVEEVAAA